MRDAPIGEAVASYRRGLSFIDRAFEAARDQEGLCLPCGRGCSSCCAALFDVQTADAALLLDWLDRQPAARRSELQARAEAVLKKVRAVAAELAKAGESIFAAWDPVDAGLSGLPADAVTLLAGRLEAACPLLGLDGECLAHGSRPALCRLQGLPWRDPVTGAELPDFCRLEPAMAENPPQSLSLSRLDALRQDANEAIRRGSAEASAAPSRSFVAAVLARPRKA